MPNYEYRCSDCNRLFEAQQSVEEHGKQKPACPHCKSQRVEPVFSTFFAQTSRKS